MRTNLFPESSLEEIERALGRTEPDQNLRLELTALLWSVLEEMQETFSLSQTKKALREVIDKSTQLSAAINHSSISSSYARSVLQFQCDAVSEILQFDIMLEQLKSFSDQVSKLQGKVELERGKGAPAVLLRRDVLSLLSDLEFKLTGKRTKYSYDDDTGKSTGFFFVLARMFQVQIATKLQLKVPSDQTIRQNIYRWAKLQNSADC